MEIINIISELKNTNSAGEDGISNNTLKQIAVNVCQPLTYIFNISLMTGVFPEKLKNAVIIPIHKSGDTINLNNYRPIALLSVFAKTFEKIIKARLLDFLHRNKFFSNKQFGFLSNANTEDALLNFLTKIYSGLNSNKTVLALFLDITKAFDTVSHSVLFVKLYHAGIRGVAMELFKSYLSNRRRCVKVNGVLSQQSTVDIGVPQGSVLGPILFIIYINSICTFEFNGAATVFADDTAFCYDGEKIGNVLSDVNEDLRHLRIWFNLHGMVLSCKSRFIQFNVNNQPSTVQPSNIVFHSVNCNTLSCNGWCIEIQKIDSYKYLGVIIDSKLKFKNHVDKVKKKLNSANRVLYLMRALCPFQLLKSLYYSFINSILQYGLVVWGGIYFSNIHPLLTIQKFAIRIIKCKKARVHTFPLFKKEAILPLRHLFVYKVLKIFYARSGYTRLRSLEGFNLRQVNQIVAPFTRK